MALLLALPGAAHGIDPAGVAVRAGPVNSVDDTLATAYSLALVPERPPRLLSWLGGALHYDLSIGSAGAGNLAGDRFRYLHFGPAWRYRPDPLWHGGYLGLGTAITRLQRERVADRRLGGRWHFTSHLVIGHRFGAGGRWHAALRIQHTSNADARTRNPGLDVPMLELGYHF